MLAIKEAIENAGIQLSNFNPYRIGLSIGTSVGGSYPFMEWVKNKVDCVPKDYNLLLHNTPNIAFRIAKKLGIQGPISVISTACASGTNSIGKAFDLIKTGRMDIMIAGGVDVFTYLTYSGFNSLGAIASGNCQPFDSNREGLNLGDAAGFVVLESLESASRRGIESDVEIGGYSIVNEAYHPTAPHPEGDFARKAMLNALEEANVSIEEIDYINAHGTATKANDSMEMKAIESLVGKNEVHVSSTKSMIGHSLGAAGSIECIATALGIKNNFIPPSIGVKDEIEHPTNIIIVKDKGLDYNVNVCLLYTSPSPRDATLSRMPSSA